MGAVDDVYTFLLDGGLAGGSTGWGLLRRRTMDAPATDQLVVVSEDGGPLPEIKEDVGIGDSALADAGVFVRVRGAAWDGDASLAKAQAVLDALHGLRSTEVGSKQYLRVRALTPEPVFAGFDDDGRPHHTVALRMLAAQ